MTLHQSMNGLKKGSRFLLLLTALGILSCKSRQIDPVESGLSSETAYTPRIAELISPLFPVGNFKHTASKHSLAVTYQGVKEGKESYQIEIGVYDKRGFAGAFSGEALPLIDASEIIFSDGDCLLTLRESGPNEYKIELNETAVCTYPASQQRTPVQALSGSYKLQMDSIVYKPGSYKHSASSNELQNSGVFHSFHLHYFGPSKGGEKYFVQWNSTTNGSAPSRIITIDQSSNSDQADLVFDFDANCSLNIWASGSNTFNVRMSENSPNCQGQFLDGTYVLQNSDSY